MNMVKNSLKKFRLRLNKVGANKRREKLKINNPTIISNNCWGGIISQYLGIPYYTPTVGIYFFADEYIKFLKKFKYYITQKLEIIEAKDSRHYEEMKLKGHDKSLVGKLEDVEIVFLHYNSKEEILEKWYRRVKRINWEYIIFKFNDQNFCEEKHIEEFENLKFKNKICFTTKKYPTFKSVITFTNQRKKSEVDKDYYVSHKYFNVIEYLNNIEKESGW